VEFPLRFAVSALIWSKSTTSNKDTVAFLLVALPCGHSEFTARVNTVLKQAKRVFLPVTVVLRFQSMPSYGTLKVMSVPLLAIARA